jgi:hypothetical protein
MTSLLVSSCFEISSPSMWTNSSTDILSFPSCNFPIQQLSYNLCVSLSSSKAKFALHVKGKILDILQQFLMFWESVSIQISWHHMRACLMFGAILLKSCLLETPYYDKTHCKSFDL